MYFYTSVILPLCLTTFEIYIVHLERNYAMSTFLKIHFFAIFELLDIEL